MIILSKKKEQATKMYIHFTYQLCKKYTKEKSCKENIIHQF